MAAASAPGSDLDPLDAGARDLGGPAAARLPVDVRLDVRRDPRLELHQNLPVTPRGSRRELRLERGVNENGEGHGDESLDAHVVLQHQAPREVCPASRRVFEGKLPRPQCALVAAAKSSAEHGRGDDIFVSLEMRRWSR